MPAELDDLTNKQIVVGFSSLANAVSDIKLFSDAASEFIATITISGSADTRHRFISYIVFYLNAVKKNAGLVACIFYYISSFAA